MWKFIKHELKYWLKTPMVWIFLFINTLLVFFAVASENVQIGGSVGNIHKNAPFVIENFYATMSILSLLMTVAFMNATANRDFQSGMHQFVFSSPIKKRDYFFGKFIGAAIISVIPMLGVSLGAIIAPVLSPLLEMTPSERFGDIFWSAHLQGLLIFGISNVIISGVLLYGLAMIFRSNIVSFIGAMLILVFYGISKNFTSDIKKEWLANILDPFGINPFVIITKYFTVDEKNLNAITLHGDLLINRLIWLAISFLILFVVYLKFSFTTKNEKVKKDKKSNAIEIPKMIENKIFQSTTSGTFSWILLWKLIFFETKTIIKNPTFIIIITIGLINLIINLSTFSGEYGITEYPVTYNVIDKIKGTFYVFMIGFITFYTGVLVWKERDAKINEIQDATPVKSSVLFLSKLFAILIAIALVFISTIVIGIISQSVHGYFRYELDVYIKSLLVMELLSFSFLVVLSLLLHYLINNRYIAYFAFVALLIVNSFIWGLLEINTYMLNFGTTPNIIYSDMNGFGPFVTSTLWFNAYWILFCVLLCSIISAFYVRGKEEHIGYRWTNAKLQFKRNRLTIGFSILAFALCASYVYYNTQILNSYESPIEQENDQLAYEKAYKKYENLIQPRYYKFNYAIDIIPENVSMNAKIEAWAKNNSSISIKELHFTMPQLTDSIQISIKGAKIKLNDKRLNYRIYTLEKILAPNDSIKIDITLSKFTKGFENEVSFAKLTQNGTFFDNFDILPSIGYNKNLEIDDKNKRIKLKLPKREKMPKLDDYNLIARANPYISTDSDWVDMNTTISTSLDQTAIAPGSLVKTWIANGRRYFNYKLDHQSLNFYSFISAKYKVARKKWKGVDLEVYYEKNHEANVPNMLKSMQKALEYYTTNFGPYYHKQCRILEFPRYASFAQSFPGTMPYSESMGFIMDLREVTNDDIDYVFFVVAHEIAHQYWAHQVSGADMQGSEMMSEGFADYSALMVMEKAYGKDKMKKFLEYEMNDYLTGRSSELEGENPLMKTAGQSYICYKKGSVVMYYLKEMIGEKNINKSLQNLISKYAYKKPPFPTSIAAVNEFRKVTPDSLQYLIDDMFENITLFSNRIQVAKYKKVGNKYQVTMKTTSEKFRANSLGKETAIPIADYIDIAIFSEPKNDKNLGKPLVYKRIKISKKDNTFTFITKELPYQVGIDPYNYLIDKIPDDNVKKLEN